MAPDLTQLGDGLNASLATPTLNNDPQATINPSFIMGFASPLVMDASSRDITGTNEDSRMRESKSLYSSKSSNSTSPALLDNIGPNDQFEVSQTQESHETYLLAHTINRPLHSSHTPDQLPTEAVLSTHINVRASLSRALSDCASKSSQAVTFPNKDAMALKNAESNDCLCPRESKRRKTALILVSRQEGAAKRKASRIQAEESRYLCPFPGCRSGFTRPNGVKKHTKSVHEGALYLCSSCDFVANRPDSVHRHERLVHSLHRAGCACAQCRAKDSAE